MADRVDGGVAVGPAGGGRTLAAGMGRVQMLGWRLLSIVLFCTIWEIAGRLPVNLAFPPFSATLRGFIALVADGSLPRAYVVTLQPLFLAVAAPALIPLERAPCR